MSVFHSCSDTSDVTPLSSSHALYLKPVARLHVSVQLPTLKTPGKSISNREVMEKLRHYAAPDEIISLKVSKSALEVVRFEAEIESRSKLPAVLARLDGRAMKLSGFHESLKVRAAEAKPDFPTRHAWDSYFRDAKNMNEMKPGERPDTIHITNMPCKWFAAKTDMSKPSEYILRKIFDVFGEVRCVDIPMLDPFRSQMKSHVSGVKMFSNNQNMIFEAYVQYKDYMSFVKTMDTLRGMKLVHRQPDGKAFSASIKVDFDKTKHMSEGSVRRRRLERERLMAQEREREELERAVREEAQRKLTEERKRAEEEKKAKLERQRQREERRKAKQLERLKRQEADEMNDKIMTEERLLLVAQRRLESYRLLGELFNQLKIKKEKARDKYKDESAYRNHRSRLKNQPLAGNAEQLDVKEKELREKLVKKFKHSKSGDLLKEKREEIAELKEEEDQEYQEFDNNYNFNDQYQRGGGHRGGPRGGRRNNNWFGRGRRGMPFMNHPFQQMPFQPFPNRGFLPQRGFPRWPRIPRGRLEPNPSFVAPFVSPYYLDSTVNDPYYKYFSKLAGYSSRRSRSLSRSRSRSRSRSSRRRSSSYSRSYSRSRSRSRRRGSRSRSRSRRRTRSRSRSRSRSGSRSRRRSRSRSRSKSKRKSRSKRRHSSRSWSHSSNHSNTDGKNESVNKPEQKLDESSKKPDEKASPVRTWSRSPSKARSLSWEKKADEPTSSTKPHKHKKEKKKEKKKKKKKNKKETE